MTTLIKNLPKPLVECMPSNGNRGFGFFLEADCTDLISKILSLNNCLIISEPENDTAITIPVPYKAIPTTINEEQVDTSKIFLTTPCDPEAPKILLDPDENLINLN